MSSIRKQATAGIQTKDCYACQFWTGNRQLSGSLIQDITFDPSEKASCTGQWKGSVKIGQTSCTSWSKWSLLH